MSSVPSPLRSSVPGNAGRLHVEVAGQGPKSVLLLHGNGGDISHWAQTLPRLARDHWTAAFDLRGMGESDAPADGSYALSDMVDDVVRVADAVGFGRFVLVGHSFGASVVAAACGSIPERLAGAFFLDGTGDVRGLPGDALQAWADSLKPDRYQESVHTWFLQLLAPATPETRARVLDSLARTPRAAYVGAMTQLLNFDPAAAIRHYGGPKAMLAVRSLDGPLSLRQAVPELPCTFVDDVSHWVQLDRPALVHAALEAFLATVPWPPGPAGS